MLGIRDVLCENVAAVGAQDLSHIRGEPVCYVLRIQQSDHVTMPEDFAFNLMRKASRPIKECGQRPCVAAHWWGTHMMTTGEETNRGDHEEVRTARAASDGEQALGSEKQPLHRGWARGGGEPMSVGEADSGSAL